MPKTTYTIHDPRLDAPITTTDAAEAEWASRAGFAVTARTGAT